jgi:hypothetical protein
MAARTPSLARSNGVRGRQPRSPMSSRGQRVAVWPQASGAAGQSPVDWWRADGVSGGRLGGASRRPASRGTTTARTAGSTSIARFTTKDTKVDRGSQRRDGRAHPVFGPIERRPLAAATKPDVVARSAGRGLAASQRGSSGQSPGNPGREDGVSVGRAGAASRRRALRTDSPPRPAQLRLPGPSRGSPKERAKCPSLRACSRRRLRSGAGLPPRRTGLRGVKC